MHVQHLLLDFVKKKIKKAKNVFLTLQKRLRSRLAVCVSEAGQEAHYSASATRDGSLVQNYLCAAAAAAAAAARPTTVGNRSRKP